MLPPGLKRSRASRGGSRLLWGRTALVTGASSGLGAHFAEVLAAAGAHVVLAARREDMLRTVAVRIEAAGGSASVVHLDVTAPKSLVGVDFASIDILVNNAGLVRNGAAINQTEEDWDLVLDTNLKGIFLVAQAAAKGMKVRGGGSIINVASILGLRQSSGVAPYAISKAGVIQLTKTLALEFARDNIRVNAIAPGYFATELNESYLTTDAGQALVRRIPQGRLGALSDLDGPLLLLASEHSRYMTGSVLAVDGGHLVSGL
jgi:NAD(P)-dependent dehydrogenase (short-subunit alcohol dehydrogenase family)